MHTDRKIVFAIRFYPWSCHLFEQAPLDGTKNGSYPAEQFFQALCHELLPMVRDDQPFKLIQRAAEAILLSEAGRGSLNSAFMNVFDKLIRGNGACSVPSLAQSACLSTRQFERLTLALAGVSPKRLASLIRYQTLWREAVCSPRFDVQDAVYKYGYTDQAHLLNDFKRFHSMPLHGALQLARPVAFLQSIASSL